MALTMADLTLNINANSAELSKQLVRSKKDLSNFKKDATKSTQGLKTQFSSMTTAFKSNLGIMGSSFGPVGVAIGSMISGLKGATVGVKTLGKALLTTGIGAIFIAIGLAITAVTAYLKGTVEGQKKLAKITGTVKGIFEALKTVVQELGARLVEAFENPKEAVESLWQFIKQNLVNRFEATVDFFQAAFNLLKNGFKGVAQAIKGLFDDDAKAKSAEFFKEAAKDSADLGKALAQMATGVTPEQFGKVGAAAKKVFQEAIKNGEKGQAQAAASIALQIRKGELILEEAKANAEIAKLKRIANDKDGATNAERLAAIDKVAKVETDIAQKRIDVANEEYIVKRDLNALGNNTIDDNNEELRLRAAIVDQEAALDNNLKLQEARRNSILNSIILYGENVTENGAKQAKVDETEAARQKKMADDELARIQAIADAKKKAAEDYAADIIATEAEIRDNDPFATKMQKVNEYYAAVKAGLDKELLDEQTYAAASLEIERQRQEEIKALRQDALEQGVEFAQQGLDALSGMFEASKNKQLKAAGDDAKKKEEIEKKFAKKQKGIAIASALINGALGITKSFAQLGPIAGIIGAALVAATTAAQIAVISSQSFAKGGIVSGTSFTGDKVPVRANAGEMVLTKRQQANLFQLANGANTGGGRKVVFEIEYDKLRGVLDNGAKITSAY